MKSYKDLKVWRKGMDLVTDIYSLTNLLPRSELYTLTSQMRRAAISIVSNIAEGSRRWHRTEQLQFFMISYASGAELETQLEICRRIYQLSEPKLALCESQLTEVMKMLTVLTQRLRATKS
jgi:four helix bundle protein